MRQELKEIWNQEEGSKMRGIWPPGIIQQREEIHCAGETRQMQEDTPWGSRREGISYTSEEFGFR